MWPKERKSELERAGYAERVEPSVVSNESLGINAKIIHQVFREALPANACVVNNAVPASASVLLAIKTVLLADSDFHNLRSGSVSF